MLHLWLSDIIFRNQIKIKGYTLAEENVWGIEYFF